CGADEPGAPRNQDAGTIERGCRSFRLYARHHRSGEGDQLRRASTGMERCCPGARDMSIVGKENSSPRTLVHVRTIGSSISRLAERLLTTSWRIFVAFCVIGLAARGVVIGLTPTMNGWIDTSIYM